MLSIDTLNFYAGVVIKMCKIGNINLNIPIIQGEMGIGVSLGRLAGAVAKQGAMGAIIKSKE